MARTLSLVFTRLCLQHSQKPIGISNQARRERLRRISERARGVREFVEVREGSDDSSVACHRTTLSSESALCVCVHSPRASEDLYDLEFSDVGILYTVQSDEDMIGLELSRRGRTWLLRTLMDRCQNRRPGKRETEFQKRKTRLDLLSWSPCQTHATTRPTVVVTLSNARGLFRRESSAFPV